MKLKKTLDKNIIQINTIKYPEIIIKPKTKKLHSIDPKKAIENVLMLPQVFRECLARAFHNIIYGCCALAEKGAGLRFINQYQM